MPQISIEAYMKSLYNRTGNTWFKESDLRKCFKQYTGSESLSSLNPLIENQQLYVSKYKGENIISCAEYALAELNASAEIGRIKNAPKETYSNEYLDNLIDCVQKKKGITLDIEQRKAVRDAVNNMFLVLTGGPGTGKTCVLSFINDVHLLIDKDLQILYTAPTGKAAKRITESTGFPASTVHHRLEITENNMVPTPINSNFKVVTCDEISMLDMVTAEALFKAIPTGTKLLLVGDTDQLPSVGPGAVLRDLIQSNKVPVARLTKTFRQAGDSILFDNIQKIKKGESNLVAGDDFKIAIPNDKVSVDDLLLYLYQLEVKKYGISEVMCLTPFRQSGNTCSNVMNKRIQAIVNPSGDELPFNNDIYRKNDIVMQLTNESSCVNGDIGKVTKIYNNGLRVQFASSEVDYGTNNLSQLTLAYAMSVHKSQGSEAKSVVTVLLNEHQSMLQRNLLYTAITRAKMNCTLLCNPEAVKKAVSIDASLNRFTMLSERLQQIN